MEMGDPSHCQSLYLDPCLLHPLIFVGIQDYVTSPLISQKMKIKLRDKRNFAKLVSGWVETTVCQLVRPREALSNSYRVSFLWHLLLPLMEPSRTSRTPHNPKWNKLPTLRSPAAKVFHRHLFSSRLLLRDYQITEFGLEAFSPLPFSISP